MFHINYHHKDDFLKFIGTHIVKHLGYGNDGCCFLMDNGLVLKRLYQKVSYDEAKKFQSIQTNSFVFPCGVLMVEGEVQGVFMEYVKGNNLFQHVPIDQDLLVLGKHLQVLEENLEYVSKEGVLAQDFCSKNVIYDYKQFKIIDTTPYLYHKGCDYTNENMIEVMSRIYEALLIELAYQKKFPKELSYSKDMNVLKNPLGYFCLLKSKLESDTNQEINTLEDAKKVLVKK